MARRLRSPPSPFDFTRPALIIPVPGIAICESAERQEVPNPASCRGSHKQILLNRMAAETRRYSQTARGILARILSSERKKAGQGLGPSSSTQFPVSCTVMDGFTIRCGILCQEGSIGAKNRSLGPVTCVSRRQNRVRDHISNRPMAIQQQPVPAR